MPFEIEDIDADGNMTVVLTCDRCDMRPPVTSVRAFTSGDAYGGPRPYYRHLCDVCLTIENMEARKRARDYYAREDGLL